MCHHKILLKDFFQKKKKKAISFFALRPSSKKAPARRGGLSRFLPPSGRAKNQKNRLSPPAPAGGARGAGGESLKAKKKRPAHRARYAPTWAHCAWRSPTLRAQLARKRRNNGPPRGGPGKRGGRAPPLLTPPPRRVPPDHAPTGRASPRGVSAERPPSRRPRDARSKCGPPPYPQARAWIPGRTAFP